MKRKALSLLLALALVLPLLPGAAHAEEAGSPAAFDEELTASTLPDELNPPGSDLESGQTEPPAASDEELTEPTLPDALNPSGSDLESGQADTAGTDSWDCGASPGTVTAVLNSEGTLTISGTGEMMNYTYESPCPWNNASIKNVIIEEGVTSVGDCAFEKCSTLENLVLPETLTSIGEWAFNSCTALTRLLLPGKLETIEWGAFNHCDALTEVKFPESLTTLGESAFSNCMSLEEVILPSGLTSVGEKAFSSSVLTRAAVPEGLDVSKVFFIYTEVKTYTGTTPTDLNGLFDVEDGDSPALSDREAPLASGNIHSQSYHSSWSHPFYSYLAPKDDGGFYRVEYSEQLAHPVMEEYDQNGGFIQSWDIPMDLPVFGGFYAGTDGFYFVFGQNNPGHSNSVEVLRVVKYSKNLERLGDARFKTGNNTEIPFRSANCRMAEADGLLYIHTGHQMYNGHQACMTLSVDTASMEFRYRFHNVANPEQAPYVSHSLNQFVRTDGTNVVCLDQGDSSPRGVALFVYETNFSDRIDYQVPFTFSGAEGVNSTGARLGGLEVSDSSYLIALSSVDQDTNSQYSNITHNAYLLAVDKDTRVAKKVNLTNYSEGGEYSVSVPYLVKLNDNRFLLLWEKRQRVDSSGGSSYPNYSGEVNYAFFDGAGNRQGQIQTMDGALSDCQPMVIDGSVVWYVTEDNKGPVFYQITGETGGVLKSYAGTASGGENPAPIAPDPSATVMDSGSCGKNGDNVQYSLYSDGTLVISGSGEMKDFFVSSGNGGVITTPSSWKRNCVRLIIQEGVTFVGEYAFYSCTKLERVEMADSVQNIGKQAFMSCTALTDIQFSERLTSIGEHAFRECAMTTAVLPKTLTSISGYAFSFCTALEHVELPENLTTISVNTFFGCTALKDLQLPESLTSIEDYAFSRCTALTEITLPQSLRSIGRNAFQNSGLTQARVYYLTEYKSAGFPAGCMVTLYGRNLTPDAPLEAVRTVPAGSANIHSQHYGNWSKPVKSYLAPNAGGGFYRVDYYSRYNSAKNDYDIDLVMEEYDQRGDFLQGWDIPRELPIFGGFFAGSDGFYFVFGQNNPNEQNGTEVIRVVKYTQDLERLGEASLITSASYEIWSLFSGASLRMAEGNGTLFIHTGKEGYAGSDQLHHESDLILAVDTATMTLKYMPMELNSLASHSFNQFIHVDGNTVVSINHGDTFPRGIQLATFPDSLNVGSTVNIIMNFGGQMAQNYTGAAVGGFEISPTHYLTAVRSINQNNFSNSKTYNVFLLVTGKETRNTNSIRLTSYSEGGSVSASVPQLVKFSDNLFAVLWEEQTLSGSNYSSTQTTGVVKYAFFDGAGNQQGQIQTMDGALSDCQPAVIDGKATWYVTENGGTPVFYQIGSEGNASSFTPAIGQKPVRVSLPENVLAELDGCKTVLAASYNERGRLTGIAAGTLKNNKAVFTQNVTGGWKLYFLDTESRPIREAYTVH